MRVEIDNLTMTLSAFSIVLQFHLRGVYPIRTFLIIKYFVYVNFRHRIAGFDESYRQRNGDKTS